MPRSRGTTYLIHFERPYRHARHYLGFANGDGLRARLEAHRSGRGARLMQVIGEAGIGWFVARIWPNTDRHFERRLKKRKEAPRLCPLCPPRPARRRAA